MRKSIMLPFLIVAIAGCKDKPNSGVYPKCAPTIRDTVYNIINEAEPNLHFGDESSTGTIDIKTGCVIDATTQFTIYFNPIIKHSKI